MRSIKASIEKYISNDQPGWVECTFTDAWNVRHIVHEKVPIVTVQDLDADSVYPQEGAVNCEIIKEWEDKDGRKIITVTTEKPWGIETITGVTEFDILAESLA